MADMICCPVSVDVPVDISISENILQVIMTINGMVSSLFTVVVLFCLHESPFVLYNASREIRK